MQRLKYKLEITPKLSLLHILIIIYDILCTESQYIGYEKKYLLSKESYFKLVITI